MTKPLSIETSRLRIRWLKPDDAQFIYDLVNDPAWLRHIGNKHVSNLDGAVTYIEKGPRKMYRNLGFGLNHVSIKENDTAVGICGLLKRETLADVEIGFALLPRFRNQGFAFEAATAVLDTASRDHDISRVVAILTPDNEASARLIGKLGFKFQDSFQREPNSNFLDRYVIDL